MVAVGLAVGGNVDQLGMLAVRVEALQEPVEKLLAAVQELFESHRARDAGIVKKESDGFSRGQSAEIGARGVDFSGILRPPAVAEAPPAPRLARGQDREADASVGQRFQRSSVGRGFRQPHSFRLPPEVPTKVGDSP